MPEPPHIEIVRRVAPDVDPGADPSPDTLVRVMQALEAAESVDERSAESAMWARDQAERLLASGPDALEAYARASLWLTEVCRRAGSFEAGLGFAGRLRAVAARERSAAALLWADLALANMHLTAGDLDQGERYAEGVVSRLPATGAEALAPPPPQLVAEVVLRVAQRLYTERDGYETVTKLIPPLLDVEPVMRDANYLLGSSQFRLGRFEDAVATWDRVLARLPGDRAAHANRGRALGQLGRYEEAIESMNEANRLRPNDPRLLADRGESYRMLGRHEDAIADYEAALAACAAGEDADAETELRGTGSLDDVMRSLAPRDLAVVIQGQLVLAHVASGDFEAAERCARDVIERGEDAAYYGWNLMAFLAHERDRPEDEIEAYSRMFELTEAANPSLRLARAKLLAELGRDDEAIEDLLVAADPAAGGEDAEERVEGSLELLDALIERRPGHARAYAVRGFTHHQAWHLPEAEADLTRAVELDPASWQYLHWRGLVRITSVGGDDEWSAQLGRRLPLALGDFAAASKLAGAGSEPLEAYRWVVDRITAAPSIHQTLLLAAREPGGLVEVLPEAEPVGDLIMRAMTREDANDWAGAAEAWAGAQAALQRARLPVWATRLHLRLADTHLRLYEIQVALDHLDEAWRAVTLHAQPLTDSLAPGAEQFKRDAWEQRGRQAAMYELEYLHVSLIGMLSYQRLLRLLRAECLSRIGDHRGAVDALGDLDALLKELEAESRVRELIALTIVLRDAGRLDDALRFSESAEAHATDARDRTRILNARGATLEQIGRLDEAVDVFGRAREAAGEAGIADVLPIELNLSQIDILRGRPEEALTVLDATRERAKAASPRVTFGYHAQRATALANLGRAEEALADLRTALALAERERGALRSFDARITRHGSVEGLHELGVRLALTAGRRGEALEILEQSKARAFMDQLASVRAAAGAEARELEAIERNLERQLSLVGQLGETVAALGKGYVDWEALDALHEGRSLLDDDGGTPSIAVDRLSKRQAELRRSIEDVRARAEDARLRTQPAAAIVAPTVHELREVLDK